MVTTSLGIFSTGWIDWNCVKEEFVVVRAGGDYGKLHQAQREDGKSGFTHESAQMEMDGGAGITFTGNVLLWSEKEKQILRSACPLRGAPSCFAQG